MTAGRQVSAGRRERRRIFAVLALCAGLAWLLLALGGSGIAMPALCSGAFLWSVPSPDAVAFLLAFVSPWNLALGWVAMVIAMMLPTACDPLMHVRQRSLRRLRPWCLALFLGSYVGVWILAGPVFLGGAIAIRVAVPDPITPLAGASVVAALWQVSPWKQIALNRCHRRPSLAALAPAAYRSAAAFGLQQGFWCLASCWALMAAALLAPVHHLAIMVLAASCIWTERREPACPPRWRLRLPARTLRMIARAAPRTPSFPIPKHPGAGAIRQA